MADREKTIKALTECIFLHEHPDDDAGCFECPYRPDEKGTCPTMIPFLKDVLELLKEQETIVRCKDCKYWLPMNRFYPDYHPGRGQCELNCWVRDSDWFCADGERR